MGQTQSQEMDRFYHRFSVLRRDPAKNVMYMEEKRTGKEYVLRELTTNDEIQKRRIEILVQEKRTTRNKFLLRLEDHFFQRDQTYCSNQFKAYLLFESHYKDLREEMLHRRMRKSCFDDDQLLSIIESGCMALKYLKELNQPHEAVCSDNILINKEGIIMLSDPWLNVENSSNFTINHIYPSPEKLQTMNNVRAEGYNWFTSDLFSLGMVVLEMANLDYVDDVYKPNYKDINYLVLEAKLQAIKNPTIVNYVERLLRSQKHRVEVVQEIDYQIKRNIKPALNQQEIIKRVQTVEKPVQVNRTVTTTTYATEPPPMQKQIQYYNVGVPETFHNQMVTHQAPPAPPPQPQTVVYKNFNSPSKNTHFGQNFFIPIATPSHNPISHQYSQFHQQSHTQMPQSNTTPISHLPFINKQIQIAQDLRRSRVENGQSTIALNNLQIHQAVFPSQSTSPQVSRGMFSKNIEVRSRLIQANQVPKAKQEIKFKYSSSYTPSHQHSSTPNVTFQKSELASNSIMANLKPVVQSQPLPNFSKLPLPNKVNGTVMPIPTQITNPAHSNSSKNISIQIPTKTAGNSTPTGVSASSLITTTSSHIYVNNGPNVYQTTPTHASQSNSAYESHSFIKKVPPPLNSPRSPKAQSNAPEATTFTTRNIRSYTVPSVPQSVAQPPSQSFSSAAQRLQQLLKTPLSPADAELFTKPEILGKDFTTGIPFALKKTTDTLTISTSREPELFSYNPHPEITTQKHQYQYYMQNKSQRAMETELSDHERNQQIKEIKYTIGYMNPDGTEAQPKTGSDFYAFDVNKLELNKVSEPQYYYSSSLSAPTDFIMPSPIVPALSLPTVGTTPSIQSDRTYKFQTDLQAKKSGQYDFGYVDRTAKTQRIERKNYEVELQKPPQRDKQFIRQTVISDFQINKAQQKLYSNDQIQKIKAPLTQYQPLTSNHPHPSIYDARIGQPSQIQTDHKQEINFEIKQHANYEAEIDNSREAKSSIAQQSMHNNSSKSLINAINMTEPPSPTVYLQGNGALSLPMQDTPMLSPPQLPPPPAGPSEHKQPQHPPSIQVLEPQPAQQNPEPQQSNTPPRPKAQAQKYNSTIAEVTQSENSGDDESEYVIQEYEVGSRYEGYKKNGMRNGKGKFYYQDGGYYQGEWKDNKMHGHGKLYYNESKLAYQGEWYLDQFHGHGKVYNDNPIMLEGSFNYKDFDELDEYWVYYQGNLVTDTKEGLGKLKLSNGQIFEGEFKYDRIQGKGKFVTISGDIINGIWKDSKLVKVI